MEVSEQEGELPQRLSSALLTDDEDALPLPPGPNGWVAEIRELVQAERLSSLSSCFKNDEQAKLMPVGID